MFAGRVVVDVDRECVIESGNTGTPKVGALDDKDRVVVAVNVFYVLYLVGAGKAAIGGRHVAVNNDLSFFTEAAKQPAEAQ